LNQYRLVRSAIFPQAWLEPCHQYYFNLLLAQHPDFGLAFVRAQNVAGATPFPYSPQVDLEQLLRIHYNGPVDDALLIRWMAEILYPQLMPTRIRESVRQTDQTVYGVRLGEADIDRLILADRNSLSEIYEHYAGDTFLRSPANR
jgi:hypothetical protein